MDTLPTSMKTDTKSGEGISTPFRAGDRAATELAIARGLLGIRSLHLTQGVVCMATGWSAYRRPRLALALLAASGIESAWLARRILRIGSHTEPHIAWLDVVFGVAGLYAMAGTTEADDRTAFLNWMCPLTIGAAAGAAVAIDGTASRAAPALLAGSYLVTVRPSFRAGGSQLSTALANATSYGGFYLAARFAVGKLRGDSEKLETARQETLKERERLAAERQRNKEHRLLHDSALQTLELVAQNDQLDPELIRSQARREANLLRRAINGEQDNVAGFARRIRDLAEESTESGLRVELALIDLGIEVRPDASEALLGALREALTNVTKHAGVNQVVVGLMGADGGVRVTIRDRGHGFDQAIESQGFGVKNSIVARMNEVGGTATISSALGQGTKVIRWAPT